MGAPRCLSLALLLLLSSSCGVGEDPSRPASLPVGVELELEQPLLEIGGVGAPEPQTFGRVSAAVIVGDSLLVVADRMNRELRAFREDGSPAYRAGGSGKGPGEFTILRNLVLEGGMLHVWDLGNRRMTSFGLDGSLASTTRVPLTEGMPDFVGVLRDGSFIVRNTSHRQSTLTKTGRSRETARFVQYDPKGDVLRSHDRPGVEMHYELRGGRRTGASLVRTRNTLAGAGGDRIYLVETGEGRLEALNAQGDPVAERTLERAVRIATPEELRSLAGRRAPRPPPPIGQLPEQGEAPVRDTFPVVDRLLVDSDDRPWIRLPVGPHDSLQSWLLLDGELETQARLTLPASAELLDAAGSAAAILTTDTLDVPTVTLWQLVGATPLAASEGSATPPATPAPRPGRR